MTKENPPNLTISTLRDHPAFAKTIADRLWNAWWKQKGVSLESIHERVLENMNAAPIPFALIAHKENTFLGTVSVITSDIDERPTLTPWIAALWVDPEARKQGIAKALLTRAATTAFALGIEKIYLCATRERSTYYIKRGWSLLEENVGAERLNILFLQKNA